MSTKQQNLEDPKSCLSKAEPNEPIFVLRANDPVAPMVVRIWASLSERLATQERARCGRAYNVALDMERWYERMYGEPVFDTKK